MLVVVEQLKTQDLFQVEVILWKIQMVKIILQQKFQKEVNKFWIKIDQKLKK